MVELIYRLFLDGKTASGICRELENRGIATPVGGSKWQASTVESILSNEKYKGDALLQKTFTTDFIEKTKKVNTGEVPQYYVEESHEAIIDPDIWAQVQTELARRKVLGRAYSGKSNLCAKLICEDCGAFYGRKVWHSTDAYRKEVWQCNGKFKNRDKRCDTPTFTTEEIHEKFIQAYNQQMACLRRFPGVTHIQILIHPEQKRLIIRPCPPDTPDALRWAKGGGEKGLTNRNLLCTVFAGKVFDLMDWDEQYRYKMMGKPAVCGNEALYLFTLTDFELFVNGKKSKAYLPGTWRDYFGTPSELHEQSYKIDLADGYIITNKT